jgi:hypothetical protein
MRTARRWWGKSHLSPDALLRGPGSLKGRLAPHLLESRLALLPEHDLRCISSARKCLVKDTGTLCRLRIGGTNIGDIYSHLCDHENPGSRERGFLVLAPLAPGCLCGIRCLPLDTPSLLPPPHSPPFEYSTQISSHGLASNTARIVSL